MKTSALMLLLAASAVIGCSGGSHDPTPGAGEPAANQATPPGTTATDAPATSSIDASVVGSWYAGRGGTRMAYDAATGRFGAPSGTGLMFVFHADGTYQKAMQSIESGYCTTGYLAVESGTAKTSGAQLVLQPTKGTLRSLSCSGAADTEKALDVQDETLTWSIAPSSQDPAVVALTLTNDTGASAELRRDE